MMTAEQFLRRCLWTPIVGPLIVTGHLWLQSLFYDNSASIPYWNVPAVEVETIIVFVLGMASVFGFIPYIWMLWAKRKELCEQAEPELKHTIIMLPFTMIPYYWKVMILPSLFYLFLPGCFWIGPAVMGIGTIMIIIVGYAYVFIWLGLLKIARYFSWVSE